MSLTSLLNLTHHSSIVHLRSVHAGSVCFIVQLDFQLRVSGIWWVWSILSYLVHLACSGEYAFSMGNEPVITCTLPTSSTSYGSCWIILREDKRDMNFYTSSFWQINQTALIFSAYIGSPLYLGDWQRIHGECILILLASCCCFTLPMTI